MRRPRRWPWIVALALAAGWWWRGDRPARRELEVHVALRPGADHVVVPGVEVAEAALFGRAPAALARDRVQAMAMVGAPLPDLSRWRRLTLRGTRAQLDRAMAALERRPEVETAFVAPRPELATVADRARVEGGACPIRTPAYERRQGYLGPAPAGIDAAAAWSLPGGQGQAVRFADIELAWELGHEDLPGDRARELAPPRRPYRDSAHGTAVLGEIAARDNGLGMIGIAPAVAQVLVVSVAERSPADAIDRAAAALGAGDVLLIELHAIGPRNRYLPMEYWDDVYEAIRLATARGVIVVEAAGNGAEDLDHPRYRGRLDRAGRDSGAILVGAGAPALPGWVDRSRLDFSNHGSRVDLQGWGRMVATTGYGDLQGCSDAERKYTARFSGTSSASPVVAGAALLVESVALARTGRPLSPAALRALLVATGSPQTDGPHGPASQHIGPRPDLRAALARLGAGD